MSAQQEVMDRPWRLVGIIAPGIAIILVARLLAANGIGELGSTRVTVASGLGCLLVGLGLCLIAARRDRFDAPLWSLAASTGLAFGAVAWISPPFADDTRVWSNTQQGALAFVGLGIGFVLAGIIALALVRRRPTPTIALTLIAAVLVVAATTQWLRAEWEGIAILSVAFATMLVAWDRSPRNERQFVPAAHPPRISRAALTLAIFALCGTAIQLYISRDGVPRGLPAVILSAILIAAAFASIYRLRRELQNRETTLSEWRSWMQEVRTNDFQEEIEGFSDTPPIFDLPAHPELDTPSDDAGLTIPAAVPAAESEPKPTPKPTPGPAPAQAPIMVETSEPAIDVPLVDAGDTPAAGPVTASAFAAKIGAGPKPAVPTAETKTPPTSTTPPVTTVPATTVPATTVPVTTVPVAATTEPAVGAREPSPIVDAPLVADGDGPKPATIANGLATSAAAGTPAIGGISELQAWLTENADLPDGERLFVAIESVTLETHDAFTANGQAKLRAATAVALRTAEPDAELISWIDGPYFVLAYRSVANHDLTSLNKRMQRVLHETVDGFALEGTLAMLRSTQATSLDSLIDEAVIGLIQSRQIEAATRRIRS